MKQERLLCPRSSPGCLRFLVSLAVQKRCPLCQGNCKNAFCQGVLPPDEITIVCPPQGAPDIEPDEYWLLQRTLYGLHQSPRHWYDKINAILCSFGLRPSLEDPCLYSGFIQDLSDPTHVPLTTPLTLGLYVNDFVYFLEDPAVEALFCRLLAERSKVDFMGVVNVYLGFISHGKLAPPPFPFISISQDLPLAWSRVSFTSPMILLSLLLPTALAFQWIRLLPLKMMTHCLLKFGRRRPTKVSWVASVGYAAPLIPISRPFIPFLLLTATNPRSVT